MLQDIGKSNHLAPPRIQTISDNLIVRIIRRGNITQGTIVFRLFDMEFQ